ncbi:MAG: serine/threonine-protein kinase, partial [Terriglobales bacterium]
MGERDKSPVEERLTSPSAPRLNTDFPTSAIVAKNYRIEQKLGDGGMGTVYKCTELALGRTVAVKFLHPHLVATSKWLLRFQQEARAVGRLSHPNIINVLSFSMNDDVPFIVMDYIKGESLAEILASQGSLSVERTLAIMTQVAQGLMHAHEQGIIHRDLKPSNIVILDGTEDAVRILDFGIAKMMEDEEPASAPKLTQTGEVFGSPAYMSPEQALGRMVDGRSDQYSFACVLYECLTGGVPFVGNSVVEVMIKQTGERPLSLSEASLGKKFPRHLEDAVARMLEKEPENRFASMNEALSALAGRPMHAPEKTESRAQPAARFPFQPWTIAVGTVATVVAAATIYFIALPPRPPAANTAPLSSTATKDYDSVHADGRAARAAREG